MGRIKKHIATVFSRNRHGEMLIREAIPCFTKKKAKEVKERMESEDPLVVVKITKAN